MGYYVIWSGPVRLTFTGRVYSFFICSGQLVGSTGWDGYDVGTWGFIYFFWRCDLSSPRMETPPDGDRIAEARAPELIDRMWPQTWATSKFFYHRFFENEIITFELELTLQQQETKNQIRNGDIWNGEFNIVNPGLGRCWKPSIVVLF
jgi:hypothetical protein